MTVKQYLADPRTLRASATITDIIPGEKPVVRLDKTFFHAQGGGQKADKGRIHTANVLHVAHGENTVDHFVDSVEGLLPGMAVEIEVDAHSRAVNAAWHTAGHHIAGAVEALYPGLKAVAGHQWPGEGRVEFAGDFAVNVDVVNAQLKADIAAALPAVMQGDPFSSRAVKIGDYPAIPCGGTHVENLSAIESTTIRSVKAKGGKIRMGFETVPAIKS